MGVHSCTAPRALRPIRPDPARGVPRARSRGGGAATDQFVKAETIRHLLAPDVAEGACTAASAAHIARCPTYWRPRSGSVDRYRVHPWRTWQPQCMRPLHQQVMDIVDEITLMDYFEDCGRWTPPSGGHADNRGNGQDDSYLCSIDGAVFNLTPFLICACFVAYCCCCCCCACAHRL